MNPPSLKTLVRILGLTMLGCVGTAKARGDVEHLILRTPQSAVTARVAGNDITSPDIQLTLDGKSVRGRSFGHTVFLTINRDEVGGTVGSQLTRLVLTREDANATSARGNFLGRLMNLRVTPEVIVGTVGACGYELKADAEGIYQGSRTCGGIPQRPVSLDLPASLTDRGPELTMATLALMLTNY